MIAILNQCPRRAPTPVIRLDSGIARAIFCLPEPLYSELVAMDRQTNALYGFFWCFAWRICHVLMMLRKLLQTRAATDAMVRSKSKRSVRRCRVKDDRMIDRDMFIHA